MSGFLKCDHGRRDVDFTAHRVIAGNGLRGPALCQCAEVIGETDCRFQAILQGDGLASRPDLPSQRLFFF